MSEGVSREKASGELNGMMREALAYAQHHEIPLIAFTGTAHPNQSNWYSECDTHYLADCLGFILERLPGEVVANVLNSYADTLPNKPRKPARKRKPAPKKPKFSLFWGLYTRY